MNAIHLIDLDLIAQGQFNKLHSIDNTDAIELKVNWGKFILKIVMEISINSSISVSERLKEAGSYMVFPTWEKQFSSLFIIFYPCY